MRVELLTWAPEYGPQIDDGGEPHVVSDPVDWHFELGGTWEPVDPRPPLPSFVQIVDGVRRVEAPAVALTDAGDRHSALFGSFAVGAVRCLCTDTGVIEESIAVGRRYFQLGDSADSRTVASGSLSMRFIGKTVTDDARTASQGAANRLLGALQQEMRDEESKLAEQLSADERGLTFVDGPLHLRSAGRATLGYIKRVGNWYLAPEQQLIFRHLAVGQRTPMFRIPPAPQTRERTSWFVRVADVGSGYDQAAGMMRVEAPADLPRDEAARLADYSARVLPRLASSPIRDPRAPQNLTPVGALERVLSHRMGDRRIVHRALASQIAAEARVA